MPNEYDRRFTRRTVIAAAGLSSGVLLVRSYSLFAAAADVPIAVEPQPYFAGVNRAVEALAKLGAPVAAADAQQIASLTRQGGSAAFVAAAAKRIFCSRSPAQ
jgi:hypothetical protein